MKIRYEKDSENRPNCVWKIWKGIRQEVIDPEIAERDRQEMEELYLSKSTSRQSSS